MKYKKINMGSYNLHLIKTDKFKTTTVSVNFADRLKKDEITIRKFLFQMLCLSTKKYNTERLLSIKLEDLYAMNLGFANIAFGSLVNSYIDIKNYGTKNNIKKIKNIRTENRTKKEINEIEKVTKKVIESSKNMRKSTEKVSKATLITISQLQLP